jgi:hypothetical protein|nr:MAG TPA: hypothetical protein [Caudoviricetes sp.]
MKLFKDVADGEVYFVRGGFELIRVNESNDYNSVLVEDSSIGVKQPDDEPTFSSIAELKAAYPEDSEKVEVF